MATVYGPFSQTVKFAPKRRIIYVDNPDKAGKPLVVRGITEHIKETFAPHYSFKKAVVGVANKMQSKNFRIRAKNSAHGINTGKKIDREMSRVIGALVKNKVTLAQFMGISACTGIVGVSPRTLGVLQRMHKSLDTRTKMALSAFDSLGCELLASQLPVACLPKRRGTTIDVVGKRLATGTYFKANLKTHSKVHYDMCTGTPLQGPFFVEVKDEKGYSKKVPVSDSQRNQDALQILAEDLLFRSQYKLSSEKVESWVVRIDADGVEVIPIPEWALKAQTYVWSRL